MVSAISIGTATLSCSASDAGRASAATLSRIAGAGIIARPQVGSDRFDVGGSSTSAGDNHGIPATGGNEAAASTCAAPLFGDDAVERDGIGSAHPNKDLEELAFGNSEVALHSGTFAAQDGGRVARSSFGTKDLNGEGGDAVWDHKIYNGAGGINGLGAGDTEVGIGTRRDAGICCGVGCTIGISRRSICCGLAAR